MTALNGVKNLLSLINNNWTTIVVIIVLCMAIAKKIKSFMSMTDEEKINAAKDAMKPIILSLVTDAEYTYEEWIKAGKIKRSQVIAKVFETFPILSKVTDQESLVAEIDEFINEALVELDEVKQLNLDEPGLEEIGDGDDEEPVEE